MKQDKAAAAAIGTRRDELVARSMEELVAKGPFACGPPTPRAIEACRKDFLRHFEYLASAIGYGSSELLRGYFSWLRTLFGSLGLPPSSLGSTVDCMKAALRATFGPEVDFVAVAIDQALEGPDSGSPGLGPPGGESLGIQASRFLELLLLSDSREAERYILGLLAEGYALEDIYVDVIQSALREVGRLWIERRIGVEREHYCTAAAQGCIARLYPRLFEGHFGERPRLLAACAGEELHELGLRMVADLLELDGWDSEFLGSSVPSEALAAAVAERKPRLVCLSATIASHISTVERCIELIRGLDSESRPVIMVGGYPFLIDRGLWMAVGADAFASDARDAAIVARRFYGSGPSAAEGGA